MSALVTGRGGLGDAIHARPFVRECVRRHRKVWVQTSWPWVFSDMPNVHVTKRIGGLAVQAWHGDLNPPEVWSKPPNSARRVSLRYRWKNLRKRSMLADMEAVSRIRPRALTLDLPPLPPSPLSGSYMLVRAPALRMDYPAPNREPDPAYLSAAAEAVDMPVATVGWYLPGLEEPNGTVPADHRFENGELTLPEACALAANAAVVVCAPCWLVPFCLAARVPMVVIAGGIGARNHPKALIDKRVDTGLVRWLLPDNYCMCNDRGHACPKHISDFDSKLGDALHAVMGVAA